SKQENDALGCLMPIDGLFSLRPADLKQFFPITQKPGVLPPHGLRILCSGSSLGPAFTPIAPFVVRDRERLRGCMGLYLPIYRFDGVSLSVNRAVLLGHLSELFRPVSEQTHTFIIAMLGGAKEQLP